MRIASWNINGGVIRGESGAFDFENWDYIAQELAKVSADIICLQEVHESKGRSQSAFLAEKLGMKYSCVHELEQSHVDPNYQLSIAILSKVEIKEHHFATLKNPHLEIDIGDKHLKTHDKGFLIASLDSFHILSGHLVPFAKFGRDHFDEEFNEIFRQVEDIILKQTPAIVGADFNGSEITKLIPRVFEEGFQMPFDEVTRPKPGQRYDKLLCSPEWNISRWNVIKGEADHYLCYADLELI